MVLAAAVLAVVLLVARSSPRRAHTAPVTVPVTARPALAAPSGRQFGVNVNLLFNDLLYTPAQIAGQLAAVRATGATVARSDAFWEASQPHAPVDGHNVYDWSFDDEVAGALAASGLTWLPILDYTAPWDESIAGQDHSPPRSDAEYADYAAAFAARYGPGGSFWRAHPQITPQPVTTIEIWNEPDQPTFWEPSPDAGAYAALYLAARDAIDAVDPNIRVIVGGLTDPAGFLPQMLAAAPALHGHIDGVAIHPYGRPATVLSKVAGARTTLDGLGLGSVPLYITEFGWTTEPAGAYDYVPAAQRPGDIATTLRGLGRLDCGVAETVLYTWVSPQRDPSDSGDWYGIADPAHPGASTPGIAAYAAGVRAAGAGGASGTC